MTPALIITSLLAGMLSVLAPCVIGILPVLMARSSDAKRGRSPWWVIGGLASSILLFSILLKSTTLLLGVPDAVWRTISGGIVLVFGGLMLWPNLWEQLAVKLGFATKSQQLMAGAASRRGWIGDVLLGASLGPVFSACSPTYLLIVATILPVSPIDGLVYLLVYIAGLVVMIAAVLMAGRALIAKLGWGLDPNSTFHKIMGLLLIVIGVLILFGIDKLLLGWMVQQGWFQWQVDLETQLRA
ncbi:hypothetical protein CR983_02040 [Candidatus Saccharibacteria bacterium]|nr:MAG: hypothetical protein CR983_02040 [Candidatus Saccharibacteria bacterium]